MGWLHGKVLKGSQKKGVRNQPCHSSHKITVTFSKILLNFLSCKMCLVLFLRKQSNSGLFNKIFLCTITQNNPFCSGLKQNKISALCISLLWDLRLKIIDLWGYNSRFHLICNLKNSYKTSWYPSHNHYHTKEGLGWGKGWTA